ncbi:MAG: glycine cleavage system protein GcvH [Elusimicrobiota bacterium]
MEEFFTKDHEWIKIEGNTGRLGITSYAVGQLGDITFVEQPETGKGVKQGDIICELESVKAASDIYAPVSGTVIETNPSVETSPGILNSSPETDGWIALIEMSDTGELANLMNRSQYDEYTEGLK